MSASIKQRLQSVRVAKKTAAILLVSVLGAMAARADEVNLTSIKVELPWGDREFAGDGAKSLNNVCLSCHSAEMVLYQPKLSEAAWTAEVNKMRTVFKAPIEDGDVSSLVGYLVKLQSAP